MQCSNKLYGWLFSRCAYLFTQLKAHQRRRSGGGIQFPHSTLNSLFRQYSSCKVKYFIQFASLSSVVGALKAHHSYRLPLLPRSKRTAVLVEIISFVCNASKFGQRSTTMTLVLFHIVSLKWVYHVRGGFYSCLPPPSHQLNTVRHNHKLCPVYGSSLLPCIATFSALKYNYQQESSSSLLCSTLCYHFRQLERPHLEHKIKSHCFTIV